MDMNRSAGEGRFPSPRAMVLSLGGSPAPVIVSLNAQRPEYVCFFVSPESKTSLVNEILPKLDYRPVHYDWIETPSAENLLESYGILLRELPRLAEKWGIPLAEFAADYTGGTKTMSVALALVTIQAVGRYTYVGGVERTKGGLGVVVDGKEKMLFQANPWDALAVGARQRASLLFARGRYEAAAEEFEGVASLVSPAERGIYQGLSAMARGYAEWDRFAHSKAQGLLSQSLRTLEPLAMGSAQTAWIDLMVGVRSHVQWLRHLDEESGGPLRVADLIANAKRRGDLEARYDDAVARLYSALEMAARVGLEARHGIRASRVLREQIPVSLQGEFCGQYGKTTEDGRFFLKLPHYAAFRLLMELKDNLGSRYFVREKETKVLLDQRNSSILAHGDKPVGEKVYRDLLPLVCEVSGVSEVDLPQFPALPV
jgi:CRISPR-associated protein (TIGR02710 family)